LREGADKIEERHSSEIATIRTQYREEMRRLLPAIADRLGVPPETSRWSADREESVEVLEGNEDESRGVFRPDGTIGILANLSSHPKRWHSMIHELLHSLSGGGTLFEYSSEKGWEEGVVEHLQQLLCRDVLNDIGELPDEAVIAEREASWRFRNYLPHWEQIRIAFDASDAVAFYAEMLRLKIGERRGELQRRALASKNISAVKVISSAKVTLDNDESKMR
jgi:hypothetical protein